MSKKSEQEFVVGVVRLAQSLGIEPVDSLFLLGRIVRGIIQHGVDTNQGTPDELTEDALKRLCLGLGAKLSGIEITTINPKERH